MTGLTATQDVGFTTLKWNPVAGATDYQIERTPVDANDQPTARRRSSASGSRSARSRRTSRRSPSRATRSATATSGACGPASAPARPPQPYSDAGRAATTLADPGPGEPADGVGEARHGRDRARDRTRPTAEEEDVHRRARRRQRPHAAWSSSTRTIQNRPHEPVHHRLPEAARHRGGDLGEADVLGQLQRARQRGLRPRVVLHDGAPARHHRGPGDPRRC